MLLGLVKLTYSFLVKLFDCLNFQPGPRDGAIQCFIKRDKSNLTYHLFLCLSPALLVENGKFLLSAKRTRRTTCTKYVISMDADNISRSSSTYIGKLSLQAGLPFGLEHVHLQTLTKGDIVFLAPPWGGPSYKGIENFTLDFLKPRVGYVVDVFVPQT
ncbi:hypothetical protein CMV_027604 [Castanea mollissima]|uniref:Tubby C-terminal domain-containing protein n=1 Tax=Castanea mollissima TaxID=60419 RepID=A0A8J4V6C2_9ROSI|nr:hypothetical protein CMV_027604 [Castanea mollissima]